MNKVMAEAQILWDYMLMNMELKRCDCIFVLGSNDLRVAEYAAKLLLDGYAEYIIFSGGLGNFTKGVFEKSEAEIFSNIAIKMGVPKEKILIENQSTNTGENVTFTLNLLNEKGLHPNSFLLVQKPFMERRAFATFKKQVSNVETYVTSPPSSFLNYPNEAIPLEVLIDTLVGDTQRVIEYPKQGFMIEQEMPNRVKDAFVFLMDQGYNKHMLK